MTTATGQTRTVTPYDYRMHDPDAAGGSDSLRIVQERADAQ